MLHELIDKDEPKCLYCKSIDLKLDLSSEWIPGSNLKADKETIECRKCREEFTIHSIQGSDGKTEYTGFTFTCKKYKVFFNYIESYFDIGTYAGKHMIAIPSFPVDFSDKKKLFEKLKTYVLFS